MKGNENSISPVSKNVRNVNNFFLSYFLPEPEQNVKLKNYEPYYKSIL